MTRDDIEAAVISSKYAEKRRQSVPCAFAGCDSRGEKILLRNGRVDWFCLPHTALLQGTK